MSEKVGFPVLACASPAIHCVKVLSIPAVLLGPSNNYRELSSNYDQGDLLKITVTHAGTARITFKKFSIKMATVETAAVPRCVSLSRAHNWFAGIIKTSGTILEILYPRIKFR